MVTGGCSYVHQSLSPSLSFFVASTRARLSENLSKISGKLLYLRRFNVIENGQCSLIQLFLALHNLNQFVKTPLWRSVIPREQDDGDLRTSNGTYEFRTDVIPFLWNSFWIWLKKFLRTSSLRKLGKTSYIKLLDEGGEEEDEEEESGSLFSWWDLNILNITKKPIAAATTLVSKTEESILCAVKKLEIFISKTCYYSKDKKVISNIDSIFYWPCESLWKLRPSVRGKKYVKKRKGTRRDVVLVLGSSKPEWMIRLKSWAFFYIVFRSW